MEDATFQSKVRRLLNDQGKSQAMLAEYLKVSPSHLSRVLKGERPAEQDLLDGIAGFFDLTLADLVVGTEHEDLAVPGRASVERETYEQLLERLREAMSAAEVCQANLAGEHEKGVRLEDQLAVALAEACNAATRIGELERDAARYVVERREQTSRVKSLEIQVDELTSAKSSLEGHLQQVEGQLRSETQRARGLVADNERLHVQIAAFERKAASLQTALERANRATATNYDAWVQAESRCRALQQRLQSAPGPGAMLLTGLIGLGAGVLATSRSNDDDDD